MHCPWRNLQDLASGKCAQVVLKDGCDCVTSVIFVIGVTPQSHLTHGP